MKTMTTERIWHYYDTLDCNAEWVLVEDVQPLKCVFCFDEIADYICEGNSICKDCLIKIGKTHTPTIDGEKINKTGGRPNGKIQESKR